MITGPHFVVEYFFLKGDFIKKMESLGLMRGSISLGLNKLSVDFHGCNTLNRRSDPCKLYTKRRQFEYLKNAI